MVAAVTLLAEPRRARLQQRRVGRAVRRVAVGAIVGDGGVLPEEGAALFRVAGVAGLVDRALDEHPRPRRTVRVVTVRTRHLGGARQAGHGQRMGRDATGLGALRLVAGEADVGLGRLAQHLLVRRMKVVAVGAGHAARLVLAAGPVRAREHAALVTLETGSAPRIRRGDVLRLRAEDHVRDFSGIVPVGVALPVAVHAPGCARVGLVAVARLINREERCSPGRRMTGALTRGILLDGDLGRSRLVGGRGGCGHAPTEHEHTQACDLMQALHLLLPGFSRTRGGSEDTRHAFHDEP